MPKKGCASNNPAGRPPKNRALTEMLAQAGNAPVEVGGAKIAGKQLLARLVWRGLTAGTVTLPDGRQFVLAAGEWIGMLKFLYQHIDGGPPRQVGEFGSIDGVRVVFIDAGAAAADGAAGADSE